jgi:hypothetical protein
MRQVKKSGLEMKKAPLPYPAMEGSRADPEPAAAPCFFSAAT